ncbi:NAD(P)-binding protein [Nocardioides sp.]|uniref:NAD(P)-binding protein n=1 Tax=Nocardioides sp. TaxID=35761 RepID=UPI00262962CA|nr:NAD(P)-binding protein [Nocardioides sp.]
MRVAIAGTGIAGSVGALLLARRGHEVVAIDRDPGPVAGEPWDRHGVMQFHQPHTWRAPARTVLARHLPDVLAAAEQEGALSVTRPVVPDAASLLLCRREILERLLWEAVQEEAGVTRVMGHVEHVIVETGPAAGVVIDGTAHPAAGRRCRRTSQQAEPAASRSARGRHLRHGLHLAALPAATGRCTRAGQLPCGRDRLPPRLPTDRLPS